MFTFHKSKHWRPVGITRKYLDYFLSTFSSILIFEHFHGTEHTQNRFLCCRLFQRINRGSTVFFVIPPVYKWCKRNSSKHNHAKNGWRKINILLYFILFYSILFYSILFYSILFYSILFYSILFYSHYIFSILLIVQKSRVYPTLLCSNCNKSYGL